MNPFKGSRRGPSLFQGSHPVRSYACRRVCPPLPVIPDEGVPQAGPPPPPKGPDQHHAGSQPAVLPQPAVFFLGRPQVKAYPPGRGVGKVLHHARVCVGPVGPSPPQAGRRGVGVCGVPLHGPHEGLPRPLLREMRLPRPSGAPPGFSGGGRSVRLNPPPLCHSENPGPRFPSFGPKSVWPEGGGRL